MITATVRYKLPPHIDYAACRAHFHKIARIPRREGPDQQALHLERERLGRRRLSVEHARAGQSVLQRALARRDRRALRHAAADRVLRSVRADRQRPRECRALQGAGTAMTTLFGVWLLILALVSPALAQPKTIDGAAIDPDAELIVAMPDDTPNMDPRIGMGSTRSTYIRQVFESLVANDDANAAARKEPPVLRRLRGALKGTSPDVYRRHLERKYR